MFYPLSPPFGCCKRFAEVLRFAPYFAAPKLHDADCVVGPTLIFDDVLRDPEFATARERLESVNLYSQSKRLEQPEPKLTDCGIRWHGMPKSIDGHGSDNRDGCRVDQFTRRWSY